jgi:hypothetical protein
MRHIVAAVLASFLLLLPSFAQTPELSKSVREVVRVDAAKVVLTHVRVIDGTGTAAVENQNVVIEGGRISVIQKGADVASSEGATILDLRGYTVMPGIVGMHNQGIPLTVQVRACDVEEIEKRA